MVATSSAVVAALALCGCAVNVIGFPAPPSEFYMCDEYQYDIDLSNQNLQYLKPFDASCNEVTSLSLANNYLRYIDQSVFNYLNRLMKLDLSRNQLSTLGKYTFSYNTGLQELYLDSNSLSTLPMGLLSPLSRLSKLDLTDNTLDCIFCASSDRSLASPSYLKYNLKFVDQSCSELTYLDLSGMGLSNINPNAFSSLVNLSYLSLGDNSLNYLSSEIFSANSYITELHLDSNQLVNLPSAVFTPLQSLETLSFSNNEIASISVNIFAGTPGLENVDMSNNYFQNLPPDLFENQYSGVQVDISQNPLNCVPDSFPQNTVINNGIHSCDTLRDRQHEITLPLLVFVAVICASALLPLIVIAGAFMIWKRQRRAVVGGHLPIVEGYQPITPEPKSR